MGGIDLNAAASKLIENGVLGIVVLGLSYAYWQERNINKEINDKRVAEAQKFYEKFIALSGKVTSVLESLTDAINGRTKQ